MQIDPFVQTQPSRGFTTSRPAILRPWLKSSEKRRAQWLKWPFDLKIVVNPTASEITVQQDVAPITY